jgi:hypothetical protein
MGVQADHGYVRQVTSRYQQIGSPIVFRSEILAASRQSALRSPEALGPNRQELEAAGGRPDREARDRRPESSLPAPDSPAKVRARTALRCGVLGFPRGRTNHLDHALGSHGSAAFV